MAGGAPQDPEQLKAMLRQGIQQIRKMASQAGISFDELIGEDEEMEMPKAPSPMPSAPAQIPAPPSRTAMP